MHAANDNSASAVMPVPMPRRFEPHRLWLLAGLYFALPPTMAIVLVVLAL